jgi:hypothetical protein
LRLCNFSCDIKINILLKKVKSNNATPTNNIKKLVEKKEETNKTTEEEAGKVKVSFEHEDFAWLNFKDALDKLKIKNNREMLTEANEFILAYDRANSKRTGLGSGEEQKRLVFSEKTKKIEKGEGIFENNDNTLGFPHKCPKCGHEEADVVDLGAPYSDEYNIFLFKCKSSRILLVNISAISFAVIILVRSIPGSP